MALPTYHCLECEKDFQAPNWECVSGSNHVVAEKRYYTADAPTVPEWVNGYPRINMAAARTLILNIPPETRREEAGETIRVPGGSVEFIRGFYATTNPEIQFYLDKKSEKKDGLLCSKERWEEVYLNDDEKMQIKTMQMEAKNARLQQEHNELLAKVKAMQADPKPERKKPGPKPKMPSFSDAPANA